MGFFLDFYVFLILFLQVIKYYSCRGEEGELTMGCWKRELASGLLCCSQEGENSPLPPKGNKSM